jgi:hypothetical protein
VAKRERRYRQRVAALAAAARAKGKQPRAHIKPRVRDEAPNPKRIANVTDPDSRLVHTRKGGVQGFNAQAVTTLEQVIVAAELTQQANDLKQLHPMLEATAATLAAAGIPQRPGTLLADAGYWTIANLTALPDAPELLILPARHGRQGKPPKDGKPTASRSDGLRAAVPAPRPARLPGGVEAVVAPTTCSSCGGIRPPGHSQRRPPPEPRAGTARSSGRTTSTAFRRGFPEVRQATGDLLIPPLSNTRVEVDLSTATPMAVGTSAKDRKNNAFSTPVAPSARPNSVVTAKNTASCAAA